MLPGLGEKNSSLQGRSYEAAEGATVDGPAGHRGLLFACISNVQAAGPWPAGELSLAMPGPGRHWSVCGSVFRHVPAQALQAQLSAGILQGNGEQAGESCVAFASPTLERWTASCLCRGCRLRGVHGAKKSRRTQTKLARTHIKITLRCCGVAG